MEKIQRILADLITEKETLASQDIEAIVTEKLNAVRDEIRRGVVEEQQAKLTVLAIRIDTVEHILDEFRVAEPTTTEEGA